MPTQNNEPDKDTISLVVAGQVRTNWSRYAVDSDFLKPADGWQLTLGLPDKVFPSDVVRGAAVQLQMGGETILSGRIDTVRRIVSRQDYSLSLSGRDDAGILVDCAAPVFSANQLTLDEVIEKIVRPLGFRNIRIQADSAPRNDKVTIEPGCRAWEALAKAAAGRGLWAWCEPDGTLVVGGPDYASDPVETLTLKNDGVGNNVLTLEDNRSMQGCFSELVALAQGHARSADSKLPVRPIDVWRDDGSVIFQTDGEESGQTGTHDMKTVVTDPTVTYYRPEIITVGDTNDQAQLDYRAKKAMSDARLSGWDVSAEVAGHRTASGVLWSPGLRVRIVSEPHGIDAVFFLMGRQFSFGRNGSTTSLRFKEDGVWIPDAFPAEKKRRHRRGKKGKKEVRIIELESPTDVAKS